MPYKKATSWPFKEAKKILEKAENQSVILFSTGYGPSGLPHIGTFAEVLRTSMVRFAFMQMSNIPTKLYCISDDMDGLRKVPLNVPNKDKLEEFIDYPLTKVPDPFDQYESFGAHNNARLKEFLDYFGFDYELKSSSELYKSGIYDSTLLKICENYDKIMDIMIPHLREERRKTYSPFMPICPKTGKVLQVKMEKVDPINHTVTYKDPQTQDFVEIPVTKGNCKLQWKIDWPMRWHALSVDYEMYGKDLIDSLKIGHKIMKILDKSPPVGDFYEHFLDDKGEKISKSKGNGISIEEWLSFAPKESVSYYMFLNPKRAKKLHFDVIPKATDDYLTSLSNYHEQNDIAKLDNPVWHMHKGDPPNEPFSHITFSLLLNLAAACNADKKETLWGFVARYDENINPLKNKFLDKLIEGALYYYKKFVIKKYRIPNNLEKKALLNLFDKLHDMPMNTTPHDIQTMVFEVGKNNGYENNLREWFKTIYEVLLGQTQGPRMGTFISLYGISETCQLIKEKTSGIISKNN